MSYSSISRSFTKGISTDQEQDANSALTELDKGLRSGKIGIQCEAIVKFPRLFEKYPFPILINSALLKIADVYRGGNNFIRLCVLKIIQQSEKHLDKIINVEEFVRRVYGVIYSNDPMARCITIRTLGSIACIIPERKNVHHIIIHALDSHDDVEVEAAIFAAEKFSEKSNSFSATICNKMVALLSGKATPVEMKLKLIPTLRHMHHNADTTSKAFSVCESLLQGYPAQTFMIMTLKTMTQLTVSSLVNLPAHVSRLLSILRDDLRFAVHVSCLRNLFNMAVSGPHLWDASNVEEVVTFLLKTSSVQLKARAINVLNAIGGSVAIKLFPDSTITKLLDVGYLFCYDNSPSLSSKGIKFLTALAMSKRCEEGVVGEAVSAVQTFLALHGGGVVDVQLHLKVVLKAAVDLCVHHHTRAPILVSAMSELLSASNDTVVMGTCEALAAVGEKLPDSLRTGVWRILDRISADGYTDFRDHDLPVALCTLVFQASQNKVILADALTTLRMAITGCGNWQKYRVGRQAMRYGHYSIAESICSDLSCKVSSEHFHIWLLGLRYLCNAELHLVDLSRDDSSMVTCVSNAIDGYLRALASIQAASCPIFPLEFQSNYVSVRVSWLSTLRHLLLTYNSFRLCPPPAISSAKASGSGKVADCWRHAVRQLEKCVSNCDETEQKISDLYWASFDADPSTFANITLKVSAERRFVECDGRASNSKCLTGVIKKIYSDLQVISCDSIEIGFKLLQFLNVSGIALARASLGFPRFFFQAQQSTVIKLAISPQASSSAEPLSVRSDTSLTVKVEGVVQHGERPALFRTVHAISITVSTNVVSRAQVQPTSFASKGGEKTGISATQMVEPHNEYFSTSFVVPFPVLGLHCLALEAGIVDERGATWRTGPRTSLSVKSYNDSLPRPPTQTHRGSRTAAAVIAQAAAANLDLNHS